MTSVEHSGKSGKETAAPSITVCVVEDDEWLRRDLAHQIDHAPGYRCLGSFGTAEQALAQLPGLQPDVVVMDINLPGLSGIECVRRLRTLQPECTVLMLTVYDESDKIFSALRAGASGYLLKRSSADELLEAIADAHHGGAPMSSSVARRVVKFFSAQDVADPGVEGLTARETEILHLLIQGHAYKEIADRLSVSVNTVRMFIRRIYKKMHVHSRAEVTARMMKA